MKSFSGVVLVVAFVVALLVPALDASAGGRGWQGGSSGAWGNSGTYGGSIHVPGYSRQDGTYVQPHSRTVPDGNPYNNYGYPGNYNPNRGEITPGDPTRYLDRYQRPRW